MSAVIPHYDPAVYPHTPFARHFFTKKPEAIDGRWGVKRAAEKMYENIQLVTKEAEARAAYSDRLKAKRTRKAELKKKLIAGTLTQAEAIELAEFI